MEPPERHTVTLQVDERCRSHARVLALIEAQGLDVDDVRFNPAGTGRATAETTIGVTGPVAVLQAAVERIAGLPGVLATMVDRQVLLGP